MCVAFPERRKPRVADAKAVGVNAVAGKGTRFAGAQAAMIAPMRGSLRIGPGTRKRALALALVAACAGPPFAEQRALAQDVPDPNVVATAAGQVRGETIDGLRVFRGIPYAAAPVGQLRWRAPRAARPWRDVRAAQDFGAPCWPLAKGVLDRGGLAPSEDCLRLNVWTRAEAGADLPVMVWIHGGALRFGHGALPLAGAQALTAKDVVLVSFNYRIGVLGFLAHEDFSAQSSRGLSGNYGILDQIAALEWVRDNIAAFGGDADNVTIFEGGPLAWSVCYLNASPRASGLFHRAILQSADCLARHPQLVDDYVGAPAGHAVGAALTAALDVPSATALRGIAADDLHARIDAASWRQAARIVYDDGEVFPGQTSALVAGDEQRVPLLLGRQPKAERRALAILPTDVPDWTDTWRLAAGPKQQRLGRRLRRLPGVRHGPSGCSRSRPRQRGKPTHWPVTMPGTARARGSFACRKTRTTAPPRAASSTRTPRPRTCATGPTSRATAIPTPLACRAGRRMRRMPTSRWRSAPSPKRSRLSTGTGWMP